MRIGGFLLALLVGGCGELDRDGVVLMVDESYRAEIVLGNADGIAAPDGLLWADGRLYIADEGGSAVRVWVPGQPVRTLADARSGLSSPEDLARGPDGTIYASDDDTGGVWRIDPAGRTTRLAQDLASTEALTLAPGGALLAGDQRAHALFAIAPDGGAARLRGGIRKPESLAFDPAGNLYVADNADNILYLLTPRGELHRPIRDRARFSPESLYYAGDALFITDSDNGKLHRYTPEDGLSVVAVFGGDLANVQGVTSDDRGNLYVSIQTDLSRGRGYVLRLARRH